MFLPIGDDNVKGGSFPIFSYSFLAINIAVFLLIELPLMEGNSINSFFTKFGGQPCKLLVGQDLFTIVTSMFLHGGWMHLIGNILFLWIFGDNIESTIGNFRFLIFYFLGGLVAVYAHSFISGGSNCVPMVGASGAIAAVMGAYLIMFPKSKIKVLFFIFPVRIPAIIFIGLWGAQEIYSGISGLKLLNEVGNGVAHWAHVGGWVFGVIAGFYFKMNYPKIERRGIEYRTLKTHPKRYNNRFKSK